LRRVRRRPVPAVLLLELGRRTGWSGSVVEYWAGIHDGGELGSMEMES
jgi:hypothetical protein